jgi:CO/xanthine dehydrogenase FAD-binding subunit
MVALNAGALHDTRFLNVWPLRAAAPELASIRVRDHGVVIGGLATFTEIVRSRLTHRLPMLRAAALEIGGWQIQNRATLAGNIANGSPAGDSLPVLLALDAAIELASENGARSVPFVEFYTGYRTSMRRPDELITSIQIEYPSTNAVQYFRKVGTRRAQAISKVVLAGVIDFRDDGAVWTARLALGSVADRPIRALAVEASLAGRPLTPAAIDEAVRALDDDIRPIDDIRSTESYRRLAARNVLRHFLDEAARDRSTLRANRS